MPIPKIEKQTLYFKRHTFIFEGRAAATVLLRSCSASRSFENSLGCLFKCFLRTEVLPLFVVSLSPQNLHFDIPLCIFSKCDQTSEPISEESLLDYYFLVHEVSTWILESLYVHLSHGTMQCLKLAVTVTVTPQCHSDTEMGDDLVQQATQIGLFTGSIFVAGNQLYELFSHKIG